MIFSILDNLGKSEWIKDGFCDDMNNNEICEYDGGDCCGTYSNHHFCLECKCICKSQLHYENFVSRV